MIPDRTRWSVEVGGGPLAAGDLRVQRIQGPDNEERALRGRTRVGSADAANLKSLSPVAVSRLPTIQSPRQRHTTCHVTSNG